MCPLPRQKARQASLPVHLIRADMRTSRLPQQVDFIAREYAAINDVPRGEDLGGILLRVGRALQPGGYFLFDVNARGSFEEVWRQLCWYLETSNFVVMAHGGCDDRHRKGWAQSEWFLPCGNRWRPHAERYEEVCWAHREIRIALHNGGFGPIGRLRCSLWCGKIGSQARVQA